MPNRIIKESICESEKLASVKDFDFRLWVCLITQADDAGRGDARPAIIKGRCFPLRESVTIKSISDSLHALASNGLIGLYEVGGRPFYWFPSWTEHQRVRDCKPKYPAPDESDNPRQSAAIRGELPQSAASCGLNPIQSESNPNPNPKEEARERAHRPTVEEVAAYCRERGNSVDAERFVDFYASKGWKVGNQPMKDWKACVRTWERREDKPKQTGRFATPDYDAMEDLPC